MLNKNTKKSKKGFTLTEVLVVVLIIGVISAIAYPVYTKSINKSRAVEAINLLEMVRNKQIANYARKGEYLPTFKDMGQLTSNAAAEVKTEGDSILTVNGKYELAMNNATNCMSAAYVPAKGKPAIFTFSSSYEDAGLGCDGDVCKTFGNIVGSSSSVCNCGDKSCSSPYNLNAKTCACDCPLACTEGGCHDKNPARTETQACGYNNSGTQSRVCPESCSSECNTSWGACEGADKGECTPGEEKDCAIGILSRPGKQTCQNNFTWGECEPFGTDCNYNSKPQASRECGTKCGIETATLTCDYNTGNWQVQWSGSCMHEQVCDKGSPNCSNACQCDSGYTWDGTACIQDAKDCDPASKPAESQPCGDKCGTQSRVISCDTATGKWLEGEWGECGNEGECRAGEWIRCGGYETPPFRECSEECKWLDPECKCIPGRFKSCTKIDYIIQNYVEICGDDGTWGECTCLGGYEWDDRNQRCVKKANPQEYYGYVHVTFTPTDVYAPGGGNDHSFSCTKLESKSYYIEGGDLIYNSAGYVSGGRIDRSYYKGWKGGKKVSVSSVPSQYASLPLQEKCNRICADGYGGSGWYYMGTDRGVPTSSSPVYVKDNKGNRAPPIGYFLNGYSFCEDQKGYMGIISCGC